MERIPPEDDDYLDGCELDFTVDPTPDADLPWVVLFAGVDLTDRAAVEARARAWRALFGQDPDWAIGRAP